MRSANADRAAHLLNLMKDTLTVRLHHSPALERGDRLMSEYVSLLEHGTDEQVWAYEVMRGAAVRWDILKRRALSPVIEPTRGALWANADRLLKVGEIYLWGAGDTTHATHY